MHEQKGGPAFTNAPASTGDRTDGARSPEELETLLEDALLTVTSMLWSICSRRAPC